MKKIIKRFLKTLPIDFTQNQKYDTQTKQVIARVCAPESNCVDVGCHKGEVLDLIREASPKGKLFGFEPIPLLAELLKTKYAYTNCTIIDCALSNETGTSSFNYVVSNPSYSGLKKRKYDRANEKDTSITVMTELLDNIIDASLKIDFIKIDVEGGELLVLEGAKEILKRDKPVVIFEHGLGASDFYDATPQAVFQLLTGCGLKVSTMKRWLSNASSFSQDQFTDEFKMKKNYYFIAY
jgi:FkbM family methyltransferase